MATPQITLEQWAAFKAVVDEGSFAKAAEALNKSQSAVSYALTKMEQQLPTPVLMQQGRKAVLTEAGQVLYRQATLLLAQAHAVEAHAAYLSSGWQTEVVIAVDVVVPMDPIIYGLYQFSQQHPQTRIRILETSLSGTDDALLQRTADLVYCVQVLPGFMAKPVSQNEMVCVVAPNHPLAQQGGRVSAEDLKAHRQVVLRDSGVRRSVDAGWLNAEQRWTVSYFGTTVNIVKQGLGFAFIPISQIKEELALGQLCRLSLTMEANRKFIIHRVLAQQEQANPAVVEVARQIDEAFSKARSGVE